MAKAGTGPTALGSQHSFPRLRLLANHTWLLYPHPLPPTTKFLVPGKEQEEITQLWSGSVRLVGVGRTEVTRVYKVNLSLTDVKGTQLNTAVTSSHFRSP